MLYNFFVNILLDVNVGENVRYRYLRNEIDVYEVICITDVPAQHQQYKYNEVSIGEKYLLFIPKIGNGLIYIIAYGGILLAKYPINYCEWFMTPAVYRDYRINQILDD
jgi:hypothetical protein